MTNLDDTQCYAFIQAKLIEENRGGYIVAVKNLDNEVVNILLPKDHIWELTEDFEDKRCCYHEIQVTEYWCKENNIKHSFAPLND